MRYLISVLTVLMLTGCVTYSETFAHHPIHHERIGRVVSVEAIGSDVYTNGRQRLIQRCTPTHVVHRRSHGGTIIGAIAGAALGNRIGGGSGRDIATAAGAVIGGSFGSEFDHSTTHVNHNCRWVSDYTADVHHVISYFIVRVHDRGQEFTIRMNHPPAIGSFIRY